jgi:hypothetical protein
VEIAAYMMVAVLAFIASKPFSTLANIIVAMRQPWRPRAVREQKELILGVMIRAVPGDHLLHT